MKQFLFIFTLPKKKKILEIREPKKKKKKNPILQPFQMTKLTNL